MLLYGTGGLAWSNNQYIRTQLAGTLNLATPGTDEAVNKYLSGWTAGGGIAVAFARNWKPSPNIATRATAPVHHRAAVLAARHDVGDRCG